MSYSDDFSISGIIYRGIRPSELTFDASGVPVFSDGAFRSKTLSAFRADLASPADVFAEYPRASHIACLTAEDIRRAGCIIQNEPPPQGHVGIYRKDNPCSRISGGSAGQMAKAAKLLAGYVNSNPVP
jgi:hypothetical protein